MSRKVLPKMNYGYKATQKRPLAAHKQYDSCLLSPSSSDLLLVLHALTMSFSLVLKDIFIIYYSLFIFGTIVNMIDVHFLPF